jgi:hypothetical protein
MAHPSVVINGVTYANTPEVDIPKSGGGTAKFYDSSEANVVAADIRNGKKAIGANGEVTGGMTEKSAATYNPATTDQTINGSQYLAGAQTIKAVTMTNLQPQYIANGVTVKVGCTADDDCVASVTGTLSSAVVSQDSTTKILSIS